MLSYLVSVLIAMMSTQTGSTPAVTPPSATAKDTKTPIVLSGCVRRNSTMPSSFLFADASTGSKYRLSGVSMRKYAGQRVEIVGGPGRRVTFRGGLVPSANVAAQAGGMDPAQAAIASMPGGANSGTGNVEFPEIRVTRVRALGGSCE
jgi:hypothetical protein